MLEPYALKGASTVLRGGGQGDLASLPDVRHEVASGTVTMGCHQPFCRLYPMGTCVLGNEEVRSSPDNVSSPVRVAVRARADTATASIEAVGDQDRVVRSTQVKCRKRRHTRTGARC